MGIWLGPRGKAKKKLPLKFETNGILGSDYLYVKSSDADGTVQWETAILRSCSLNIKRTILVDLWLVAGGSPGSLGSGDATGGDGGTGGGRLLVSGIWLRRGVNYAVAVGASDEPTAIAGSDGSYYSIPSGQGSPGGLGAIVTGNSRTRAATAGSDGVFAYHEAGDTTRISALSGRKYGAGAGGGEAVNSDYVYSNSQSHGGSNAGGNTGGGAGGIVSTGGDTNAAAGAANTGAAGGGAYRQRAANGKGGAGGSGILMLRPHKIADPLDYMVDPDTLSSNSANALAAVAVAKTWWDARRSGDRTFVYRDGRTFFHGGDATTPLNNASGAGIIDCSTYIGLVLLGYTYEASPYAAVTEANADYDADMLSAQTGSCPWADSGIRTNNLVSGLETGARTGTPSTRTAAQLCEYFWAQGRCFTDHTKRRPGDIIFHSAGTNNRFLQVSHVSIVCDDTDYFYNVTNISGVIVRTAWDNRNADIVCYARPAYRG